MKKSVILLIAVLYVVSIVVVTFFGMQISMDQFKVYMNKVEITNYTRIVGGKKYLDIAFDDTEGYVSVFVEYETGPDNATEPSKISFLLSGNIFVEDDGTQTQVAEVTKNGEVVFSRRKTVLVTIFTTDGSQISDSMYIRCK